MIIPFLKHITKIQNQRGDVKFFVVFFSTKTRKRRLISRVSSATP